MIPMELCRIVIRETSPEQHIYLRETTGKKRQFPIVIGQTEAFEIHRKVNQQKTLRPMTHDLLSSVIEQLDATLKQIVVTRLESNTFFAKLVLARDGREIEIDSRPSDAIALAVRFDAPIFVEEDVIAKVAPPQPEE
jgi:bifunctional DNase/RNase